MAKLWGPRFDGIARQGRELGLAFASAQLVHVGLVFWLFHISDGPSDRMLFFWVGILCTYLLALLSFIQFRNLHAPRIWWWFRTIATEYIAFVFALDFILDPIRSQGTRQLSLDLSAVCSDAHRRGRSTTGHIRPIHIGSI